MKLYSRKIALLAVMDGCTYYFAHEVPYLYGPTNVYGTADVAAIINHERTIGVMGLIFSDKPHFPKSIA